MLAPRTNVQGRAFKWQALDSAQISVWFQGSTPNAPNHFQAEGVE
jgi:hypothetical protein